MARRILFDITEDKLSKDRLHVFLCLVLFVSSAQSAPSAVPQNLDQVRPLSYEDVLKLVGTVSDARIRQLINGRWVNFELTPERADQLIKKGASQELLILLIARRKIPAATLEVRCNVECNVVLDGKPVGKADKGRPLVQAGLAPGKVTIEVSADGYQKLTAEVNLEGNERTEREFSLKPLMGGLEVTSDLEDCELILDGQSKGRTQQRQKVLTNLKPGRHTLEARAIGFKTLSRVVEVVADKTIPVALKLEKEAPPLPSATDLLGRILNAFGGEASLEKELAKYRSSGQFTLISGRPSLANTEAQVSELIWYPEKIRWDLKVAGLKWTVVSNGQEIWSDGNSKFKGSELGQELERNIRAFLGFRLPALLARFRDKSFKLGVDRAEGDQLLFQADLPEDRYTVTLDMENRPTKIVHESLTGLRKKMEVVYERYQFIENRLLPYQVTLRYLDQPGYGHEMRYNKIEPSSAIKEGDFKRGFRLIPRL